MREAKLQAVEWRVTTLLTLRCGFTFIPFLRAKQAKRDRLYQQKGCYVNGMWNVNSVMMGGLGGDPEIPSSEEGTAAMTLLFRLLEPVMNI